MRQKSAPNRSNQTTYRPGCKKKPQSQQKSTSRNRAWRDTNRTPHFSVSHCHLVDARTSHSRACTSCLMRLAGSIRHFFRPLEQRRELRPSAGAIARAANGRWLLGGRRNTGLDPQLDELIQIAHPILKATHPAASAQHILVPTLNRPPRTTIKPCTHAYFSEILGH
jgi:hypothetical protein